METRRKPVVVGYDGESDSEPALEWGIRTAGLTGRELMVVVAAPSTSTPGHGLTEYEEDLAEDAAQTARDAIALAGDVTGEVVTRLGGPIPVLLNAAADAELLVVGSPGHSALGAAALASVSHHLAGHAACPVAVVRGQRTPQARTIVVGVDGSPASVRALHHALERASLSGEAVHAVHAYRLPTFTGPGLAVLADDLDHETSDQANRYVAELVAGVGSDYPDVRLEATAVVGRAGKVLAHLSEDASLVVVGSRGRNPWPQLVLGSVSADTLHRAACPVVVVR